MPFSSELNPSQQAEVESIDGPLLMIAGPGAGKTKTLVERIVHLIVDEKIDSAHILVATFTEKAAKELVSRVSNRAIELANGNYLIAEVKGEHLINDPVTMAKIEYAKQMADASRMQYVLVPGMKAGQKVERFL